MAADCVGKEALSAGWTSSGWTLSWRLTFVSRALYLCSGLPQAVMLLFFPAVMRIWTPTRFLHESGSERGFGHPTSFSVNRRENRRC
jgi:hypothetical protein